MASLEYYTRFQASKKRFFVLRTLGCVLGAEARSVAGTRATHQGCQDLILLPAAVSTSAASNPGEKTARAGGRGQPCAGPSWRGVGTLMARNRVKYTES